MPPSDSGTAVLVLNKPSIAASLTGWFSATTLAIQSPTPIWIGDAIAATVSGISSPKRW